MTDWIAGAFCTSGLPLEKGGELSDAELAYVQAGDVLRDQVLSEDDVNAR
jgi:hypothetical protein